MKPALLPLTLTTIEYYTHALNIHVAAQRIEACNRPCGWLRDGK